MIRAIGAKLALAAALSFALLSTSAPAVADPAREWPQAQSDLAPDPAIRFGVLPNGMRYALRRQTIPAQQTSLRLWIHAGSLMEAEDQRGLAHFLEHMAFNGSEGVKEGEMVKILERLGLSFGGDTNASTGFAETVYKFDLPKSSPATIDTSLMLFREIASRLSIRQDAVDRERGVVLSEERARDAPAYRAQIQRLAFLMPGQRLPNRLPIGKVEVLKTAPASRIADFYSQWYRPDRAVLVAVGDFDLDDMDARVRKAFSDWSPGQPGLADPDQGPIRPRGPEARVVVEPGVQASLQLIWTRPPPRSPDTAAKRRAELYENLGFAVLNRRFSAITRTADPPFQAAGAFETDQDDAMELTGVSVSLQPDRWREGLAAVEQGLRRLILHGVRQDELDREIEETRAALRATAASAATRRQSDLAGEIVDSLADRTVVTSPAADLEAFEAAVRDLRAATVNAAVADAYQGNGPLVFMASPTPIAGGNDALLAALTASQATPVAPSGETKAADWPYARFGPAGLVAQRRDIKDLGASFIRFRNGVRLTVKSTKFRDDEVLVRVNVGGGMLDLARDRQSPYWATGAFIEGGLGRIGVEDMERALAAKVYGARFAISDDAFVLSGATRTVDLPTQLQVLAAYLTDAAWGEAAFQRIKVAGQTVHAQYEATDEGVMSRDLSGLIHSGDRRWTFPSRQEIAAATLSDLRAAIAPSLAKGAIEIVVVGDVTVEQAVVMVAATFGALPSRATPRPLSTADRRVTFPKPAPAPIVLTHQGRADQASALIAWPTTDFWADPKRAREVAVLREVIRLRLTDQLREAQGVTYSPDVTSQHSQTWKGWGYISADIEAPPEKLPGFFRDVEAIAADLSAHQVGADELARAKTPRLEALQRARLTNGYWLGELSGAQADPRRLTAIRDLLPATRRVTAADIRRAAAARLVPGRAWKLIAVPAAAQAAATRPSP